MKKQPPHDDPLDAALRQGAQAQREQLAQARYPVGDYPPRPAAGSARHDTGGRLWPGFVAPLAIGGGIAAMILAAFFLAGSPQPTPGGEAATGSPLALGNPTVPVRALLAQIETAEQQLGQRLETSLDLAAAWPGQVRAWGESLGQTPAAWPEPVEQEIVAVRRDLAAAAAFVRQKWRAPDRPSPPTGSRPTPRVEADNPPVA